VNEPILQIALREMSKTISSYKFWLCLFSIICILALSAPFGSNEIYNLIQRFFYWGAITLTTCFIGFFVNITISTYFTRKTNKLMFSRAVSAISTGIVVSIWVYLINAYVIGIIPASWPNFLFFALMCTIVTVAISTLMFALYDTIEDLEQRALQFNEKTSIARSTFYHRLPRKLGTDIISLNAQDHYVEVTTTKGRELILIRLSDAISELEEIAGQQIHRSWWVTKKHIANTKRKNGRLNIVLSNENEIAVSRSYLEQTKLYLDIK